MRARVLDDGAGGLVFREWYDTELATSCSFRLAADGAIRCLPWQSKPVLGLDGRDIVYTDAQCSRAALGLAVGVPVPALSHADPAPGATCSEQGYPVRRVGAVVDHDGSYYFRRNDECASIAAGLPRGAKAYLLEEEISPQAFLSARRVVSENGGRLRPIELHGDDGSFERAAIWDAARGEECSYGFTKGDVCVPEVAYLQESFADAECSVRAAWPRGERPTYSRPPCVELEMGAEQAKADACGHFRRPRLFRLGTLVDTVPAFASDGEACAPLVTEAPYYPVASELPDDTLGVIATVTVGKGRLRLEGLVGDDGTRLDVAERLPRLTDSQLNTACSPLTSCAGEVLCEPIARVEGFADPECQSPIVEVFADRSCADDVPHYVAVYEANAACWAGELGEVGERAFGERRYGRNEGSCLAVDIFNERMEPRRVMPSEIPPLLFTERVE